MGESITEAIIARWEVSEGQSVQRDDALVELETDKITVVVSAPAAGRLIQVLKSAQDRVQVGETLAYIELAAEGAEQAPQEPSDTQDATPSPVGTAPAAGPAARRLMQEQGVDAGDVVATGPRNTITKEDVLKAASSRKQPPPAQQVEPPVLPPAVAPSPGVESERAVPMSPLRKRIAQRLLQAQHDAAILTTFNELDMSAVLALRKRYQSEFTQKYGVKLGFMGFFVKACVGALRAFPLLNAEIRDEHIVYKDHIHIGVAVGGGKGLVVPVIRHAAQLSLAELELELARLAEKARQDKLGLDELSGGTFTISNGGVYGSMMSTPIINPPQSGILGLHRISERVVAIEGKVEIRPMMYIALSYDHRIVDGREAVQFLVKIKDCVEDPSRLLLQL
jgi:2-oxoglutarate dehydrogenase E2 component (dihydrolipoamide succinyltransferase)